jgi:hypothetical protein
MIRVIVKSSTVAMRGSEDINKNPQHAKRNQQWEKNLLQAQAQQRHWQSTSEALGRSPKLDNDENILFIEKKSLPGRPGHLFREFLLLPPPLLPLLPLPPLPP